MTDNDPKRCAKCNEVRVYFLHDNMGMAQYHPFVEAQPIRSELTPEQQQRADFAYGNTKLHNPEITREMCEDAVRQKAARSEVLTFTEPNWEAAWRKCDEERQVALAEIDFWKHRAQDFQRQRAELFDKLEGTPCEQIRHEQEIAALKADLKDYNALRTAVNDGPDCTCKPNAYTHAEDCPAVDMSQTLISQQHTIDALRALVAEVVDHVCGCGDHLDYEWVQRARAALAKAEAEK